MLVCSAPEPQGYGTGDGEGARREGEGERLCSRGAEAGMEGLRVRGRGGYSVAAESPPACLLRSTSD